MFDKWLNLPAHLYLRITALTILVVGVALSNVLMSIGTIWIFSNWLIQAEYKSYWAKLQTKKSLWWIILLYAFLAISLFWSDDLSYGFKDLRIKLPFIVIPLVLATSKPLSKIHFHFLLYVFLGVVFFTSGFNFLRYNLYLELQNDIREMSFFISHVRFSLLVNFAFFTTLYLLFKKRLKSWIAWLLMVWFLFYLYKSQIINGYLIFGLLFIVSSFYLLNQISNHKFRKASQVSWFVALLFVIVASYNSIRQTKVIENEEIAIHQLDLYTENNNPYFHDTSNHQMENGNYVWQYVQQEEMESAWNGRATIPYDSLDRKGQPMFGTLMRFLTSKGYRKDSAGVYQLTPDEILNIENGQTSIALNKGFESRLASFFMEYRIYQNGGDPNGNSILQRAEHFKAAVNILKNSWLFGVGNGDVQNQFYKVYEEMNTRLSLQNQHRSHNQFLTIWVSLGVVGFTLFFLLFITPWFEVAFDFFALFVLIGLFVSCLFQDLIETQAGVTIFALFYGLALYRDTTNQEVLP